MFDRIHPDGKQNEVLALPPKGHTVVLGTAGSGKTTMALLRAIGLSNYPEHPKVLLVTFNRALVQYMKELSHENINNITIESFHKFARGYLNSLGKMPSHNGILDPDYKINYINTALCQVRTEHPTESTLRRPLSVFVDEIAFIQHFGFSSLEEYVQAERIGRASANIKRENRKWFYEVLTKYQEIRNQRGYLYDWDDLAYYVYIGLLADCRKKRYDHIIVDEGQDFSPIMIKALTAAVGKNGSFTFFGDVAQQIYGTRLSWRDSGINIRDNKVWRFDKNYRNPVSIVNFASDIMKSPYWSKSDDTVMPIPPVAEGPKPVLVGFKSKASEVEWLVKQIKTSMNSSSNVVVCRNRSTIDELKEIMNRAGVCTRVINKDQAGLSTVKGVYLSTYHSVKGLEFENVFVPFLTAEIFPDPSTIENAADTKSALADELKLLYVATTRSKYGLLMSYHESLTCLFPNTSINYEYINGEELV